MDNFTHSLAGWALGQTGLKRKTRKGLAALILGANAPDIDVFFGWVPWEPLATHRGVTHSFFGGIIVLPIMLAGLLLLLDRWQVKRGATFKSGLDMHFGWLVALSYLGALTHPLLDWQNTYAVQFFTPFDKSWYHNDSLFIIDVWIWSGLAFAIWLSRRREKRERLTGEHTAWRTPTMAALAAVILYIGGNSVITSFAKQAPSMSEPYVHPEVIFAGPEPVRFYARNLVWRKDGEIGYGLYNPLYDLMGLERYEGSQPDGMDDPIVPRAMKANANIRDFMAWSVLPVARVKRGDCDAVVTFSDARYNRLSFPQLARGDDPEKDTARKFQDGFNRRVELPLLPEEQGTDCPAPRP